MELKALVFINVTNYVKNGQLKNDSENVLQYEPYNQTTTHTQRYQVEFIIHM